MNSELDIVSIKTILSLIIILGLMVSFLLILKKYRPGSVYSNKGPVMRTIGTLNLAPKRAIALIEVCEQFFIIGIGSDNVSLISRLDIPPEKDFFNSGHGPAEGKFQSFLEKAGLSQKKVKAEN